MESNEELFASPDIESAIDRSPVIIAPDTLLVNAIALMSDRLLRRKTTEPAVTVGQSRGISCEITKDKDLEFNLAHKNYSCCVLVMEGSRLRGILTERDIVRLTAEKLAFESVTVGSVMTQPVVTLAKSNLKDIFAALFLFRRYRIRHLPIVDQQDRLLGIISPETIRQAMRPTNLLKLRRVSDVMSKNIIHAPSTDTVLSIAQLMAKHRVSCIIITEADEEENILIPAGIITERDILQFQFLEARLDKLEAGQVMSSPLFLLSPEDSLLAAHQEMQRRRVRRLVVSWNWGRELGIVTQTSMLRIFDPMEMYSVIETLQSTVRQLEQEKADLLNLVNKRK